jgi:hypothetical protein
VLVGDTLHLLPRYDLVGVRVFVQALVIDEAGCVTLIRLALCLVAELAVVHQSDRLKRILACLGEATEKVREVILAKGDELIRVGVRWVDKSVGRQESFLDEPENAAEIVVDRGRAVFVPEI